MVTIKDKITSLIDSGKLCCWDCKETIPLKSILFLDFDNRVVTYVCRACNKIGGVRSFKSIGLNCSSNDISKEDLQMVVPIVANGRLLNPSVVGGNNGLPFVEILKKRANDAMTFEVSFPKVKKVVKPLDIDKLPVCDEYKKALIHELEIVKKDMGSKGVEEFWRSFYDGAFRNRVTISTFIKQCEREFLEEFK